MKVSKRAVCYFCGFDPRGARFYHAMYRSEGKKQLDLTDNTIKVSKRTKKSDHINQWKIEWTAASGDKCETDYHVFSYDDIIKNNWAKNEWDILKDTWTGYYELLRTGLFWKGWKVNWPTMVAASYPLFIIVATLLLGVGAAASILFFSEWHLSIRILVAALVFCAPLYIGRLIDQKWNHYWVIRSITFGGLQKYRKDSNFTPRMQELSKELTRLDESAEYDEILLIGHSFGTVMGTELISQTLNDDPDLGTRKANVSLVTLGGSLPFIASHPGNTGFRNALKNVSLQKQVDWIDIAARVDGPSFSMIDPMSMIDDWPGLKEDHLPRLFPARFFKCFSEEGYRNIKKNRFQLHFQYILSTELDGEYNFFKLTAGTQCLKDLYPEN